MPEEINPYKPPESFVPQKDEVTLSGIKKASNWCTLVQGASAVGVVSSASVLAAKYCGMLEGMKDHVTYGAVGAASIFTLAYSLFALVDSSDLQRNISDLRYKPQTDAVDTLLVSDKARMTVRASGIWAVGATLLTALGITLACTNKQNPKDRLDIALASMPALFLLIPLTINALNEVQRSLNSMAQQQKGR